jgi:hypothetical protein
LEAGDNGTAALVGTWTAEAQGVRVRVVFGPDGTFARTMTDVSGAATVHGQYLRQGNILMVQPQGLMPMQFMIQDIRPDRLVLAGMDGTVLNLARFAPGTSRAKPTPSAPSPPAKPMLALVAPESAPAGRPTAGNGLVPDWVRPGLRLTYDLLTGSIGGSVNGWVLDDDGRITDRNGNRYSTELQGHSSHLLVEATAAGMDGQMVALRSPST